MQNLQKDRPLRENVQSRNASQDRHKDRKQEQTYKAEAQHLQAKAITTKKTQGESETSKQHPWMTYHKQEATNQKKMHPLTPKAHVTLEK